MHTNSDARFSHVLITDLVSLDALLQVPNISQKNCTSLIQTANTPMPEFSSEGVARGFLHYVKW